MLFATKQYIQLINFYFDRNQSKTNFLTLKIVAIIILRI